MEDFDIHKMLRYHYRALVYLYTYIYYMVETSPNAIYSFQISKYLAFAKSWLISIDIERSWTIINSPQIGY